MAKVKQDDEREEQIAIEILVDTYPSFFTVRNSDEITSLQPTKLNERIRV